MVYTNTMIERIPQSSQPEIEPAPAEVVKRGKPGKLGSPGSVVELHYEGDPDDETVTVTIIEDGQESKLFETLLYSTRLGKELLGKTVDDIIHYASPDGMSFEIQIKSIDNSNVKE